MAHDSSPPAAVEEISLDDALPFDSADDTPEVAHPEFIWVKFAAEDVPANGLDYSTEPSAGSTTATSSGVGGSFMDQAARALSGSALADEIARALAPRLRALARPVVVPPDDAFVDQDAGLFDREVYLRLARKDVFPNRKIGHKRIARWADVKSALAKAGAQVKLAEPTDDPEADLLNEIRQRAGLAVKGGR